MVSVKAKRNRALEFVEDPIGVIRHRTGEYPDFEVLREVGEEFLTMGSDEESGLRLIVMDQGLIQVHNQCVIFWRRVVEIGRGACRQELHRLRG